MKKIITDALISGAELRTVIASNMVDDIEKAAVMCIDAIHNTGKIILMGNGGSAADAQHIAGELVGRFLKERKAIPAIAITTDTSIITALGNDYGYEKIFERQIEAIGNPKDLALAISTSGNSENIHKALEVAKKKGMKSIGLLGCGGGKIKNLCDLSIIVPSDITPRVQEMHIAIGHIICELIEDAVYDQH